ncbi:uncharacterized protein B0P05DRAFT_574712 [Gilbertella persicaria]|uniref:uncharacterized protein n=1 Tax=Gilbertella persicaria TaxID=101096 RepID=UPI00221E848A|nr:uncharacterized protein B0P05DRAFT_574712 [Gilbertella persicaria]KAI8060647.1 hypothetical protein B0P05DRAFT_574712 [Gilbertella persicaria]
MEEVDICNKSNPKELEFPIQIRRRNKKKKNYEETENNKNEKEDILFDNIVDFIDYVYRTEIEFSPDSLYKLNYVYHKEILGDIWIFTKKVDKTKPLAFTQ